MSNRTNSKLVLDKMRDHVTQSVSINGTITTFHDASGYVWGEFVRVTDNPYYIHHFPKLEDRFSEYLNGLPHEFLFYYNDIELYLDTLDLNNNSKSKFSDDKIIKMYHHLIFMVVYRSIQN
jgi:hypothetical protein